ncbi:MAG: hypothetical protein P4L53_12355 [Candidatus Obscuribacterales bacterium]|nr:hypothetical protein [Candidatus Obscuribacterales bacterium]
MKFRLHFLKSYRLLNLQNLSSQTYKKLADKLKFESVGRVAPAVQWLIENSYIEAAGDGFRISVAGAKYVRQQLAVE